MQTVKVDSILNLNCQAFGAVYKCNLLYCTVTYPPFVILKLFQIREQHCDSQLEICTIVSTTNLIQLSQCLTWSNIIGAANFVYLGEIEILKVRTMVRIVGAFGLVYFSTTWGSGVARAAGTLWKAVINSAFMTTPGARRPLTGPVVVSRILKYYIRVVKMLHLNVTCWLIFKKIYDPGTLKPFWFYLSVLNAKINCNKFTFSISHSVKNVDTSAAQNQNLVRSSR